MRRGCGNICARNQRQPSCNLVDNLFALNFAYLRKHKILPIDIAGSIDLQLFPYGNAREKYDRRNKTWVFRCQHGNGECRGGSHS